FASFVPVSKPNFGRVPFYRYHFDRHGMAVHTKIQLARLVCAGCPVKGIAIAVARVDLPEEQDAERWWLTSDRRGRRYRAADATDKDDEEEDEHSHAFTVHLALNRICGGPSAILLPPIVALNANQPVTDHSEPVKKTNPPRRQGWIACHDTIV